MQSNGIRILFISFVGIITNIIIFISFQAVNSIYLMHFYIENISFENDTL